MRVITYQAPRGQTINLSEKQIAAFEALGSWPKNDFGEEYCQVSQGLHQGEPDPWVIVETMPDHHRSAHREARNWGVYPLNGAVRKVLDAESAQQLVDDDPDGYASIVEHFGLL